MQKQHDFWRRYCTGQIISSHAYILGPTGQRLKISEANGRVVDYQYDPLYRLTQEKITDPAAGSETLDFAYDAVGNRLTQVLNGVTTAYTYDDNDRLLTEGAISYTYDANGNTLTKTGPEGVVTSVYDAENRLVSVSVGGSTLAYSYDDSGIKVQATVDGITTDYLVDANRDYAQVLEELDSAGQATVQYRYGDDLISQVRDGQSSYYHYDGLGSTRALSDQAGVLANSYQYRPFGELAHSTGNIANNYLFAGEQFEPKTGLYYLRARWMGPGNGRFTGMDSWDGEPQKPITSNKYLYADANPIIMIDPSGRNSIADLMVGLGLVALETAVTFSMLKYIVKNKLSDSLGIQSPFAKKLYDRWWSGTGGPYSLTPQEFYYIKSIVLSKHILYNDEIEWKHGEARRYSFRPNEYLRDALGDAWIFFDNKGNITGFGDVYDFSNRGYGSILNGIGKVSGAKDYFIKSGNFECINKFIGWKDCNF